MVYAFHRRVREGGREEGRLKLLFCCSAREKSQGLDGRNKESRVRFWAAYLVFPRLSFPLSWASMCPLEIPVFS